jgi:hypothetical protein
MTGSPLPQLDALHHRVADDGVEPNWQHVAVVHAASRAPAAVLDVLADPTAPEIVRQRAYARAIAMLPGTAQLRPTGDAAAVPQPDGTPAVCTVP